MTTVVTLSPFNVQYGGSEPNVNSRTLPGPVPFGGGSISDSSDSSGVEIGTLLGADGDQPDLLLADFATPSTFDPAWIYLSIRAKSASGADQATLTNVGYYRADDPTGRFITYNEWPHPLRDGQVTTPTWFHEFYDDAPITEGDPGDETNWANLTQDWPELRAALTTTGLRVGIFATSSALTRVPVLDLYELRLVAAGESRSALPPLRQVATDAREATSAARIFPSSAEQNSLRRLGYF